MTNSTYKELLMNRGFNAFLATVFLGVINDNAFRFIVTFMATDLILQQTGSTDSSIVPIIGAVFTLPFILFSGYGGYLGDAFNKRSVLIVTKSIEILSMLLGIAALYFQSIPGMLFVLFLMTTQSTLFSPAKYGVLPEMVQYKDLSKANGLLEMFTFLAILLGTVFASVIYTWWQESVWVAGIVFTAIALTGTVVSFGISQVTTPAQKPKFHINPWSEITQGIRHLYQSRSLWLTVISITYFWFIGALIQQNVIQMGTELQYTEIQIGVMFSSLALGIGIGCIVAGFLSGSRVELGFVPFGAFGIAVSCICMSVLSFSWMAVVIAGYFLGFSGGFYSVPLYAFLQAESGSNEKGRFLATSNFINTIGILLASILLMAAYQMAISTLMVYVMSGVLTLLITAVIVYFIPIPFYKLLTKFMIKCHYRINVRGIEHVPKVGPALLVSNHISYLDGIFLALLFERMPRFLVYKDFFTMPVIGWVLNLIQAIPIKADSIRNFMTALKQAKQFIEEGQIVGIFAEGSISRNGNLTAFKGGYERIVKDMDCPIIPVHIAGLWNSRFSHNPNIKSWGLSSFKRVHVEITFGQPLPSHANPHQVRNEIAELSGENYKRLLHPQEGLHLQFIRAVKQRGNTAYAADTTGRKLSHRKMLAAAFVFSRWLKTNCADEYTIGIMLPTTVFGAVVNVAVSLAGKTAVNINFTAGDQNVKYTIDKCKIKTVVTSKKFLKKIKMDEQESMVFLEELQSLFSKVNLLKSYAQTFLPFPLLKKWYSNPKVSIEETATVLFSSGSSGDPKGVMLSHANILTNLQAISIVFQLQPSDKIAGLLPFFHAFGYTVTIWLPLIRGFSAVYHTNPFESKAIGDLVNEHQATLLISTPTFYHAYSKKIAPEKFSSLRLAVTGAEKLSQTVRDSFHQHFGKRLLEGYGCTELSPVVSVNTPDMTYLDVTQQCQKVGTVGLPIPGVCAKTVDIDTKEDLGVDQEGLLLIKGPNVMQGYLNDEERTNESVVDGWYNTGDIAKIDEEGFITITDRLSRFCKIGGEMVPLIKIEDELRPHLVDGSCAATSIPDEARGEKVILFYTEKDRDPSDIREILMETQIPNLWIPKEENIRFIEELPTLPSGKLDLRTIKAIAFEKTS